MGVQAKVCKTVGRIEWTSVTWTGRLDRAGLEAMGIEVGAERIREHADAGGGDDRGKERCEE